VISKPHVSTPSTTLLSYI